MVKIEKFWDKLANNYDKIEKRFEKIHIKTLENTKKYLNINDIVLDYGCATGTKAFEIASNVNKIHGIDISSKMIESAKKNAVERKIENVNFTQTTIFDEKLKNESFDVILVFNILHLLEDNQKAMQRITELLKLGGFFISVTPCLKEKMTLLNNLEFYLLHHLSKIGLGPSYLEKLKISELEELIVNGNLQLVETEKMYNKVTYYFIVAKKVRKN